MRVMWLSHRPSLVDSKSNVSVCFIYYIRSGDSLSLASCHLFTRSLYLNHYTPTSLLSISFRFPFDLVCEHFENAQIVCVCRFALNKKNTQLPCVLIPYSVRAMLRIFFFCPPFVRSIHLHIYLSVTVSRWFSASLALVRFSNGIRFARRVEYEIGNFSFIHAIQFALHHTHTYRHTTHTHS